MFSSGILPDRHTVTLGLALLAGLLWVSALNYVLFQVLVSIFTIVATFGVFVTAWNSRDIDRNAYLAFIGIAYLFVGLIELLQILQYKSMAVFAGDANLGAQLRTVARCLQSVSLLVAPFLLGKRLKTGYVFTAFSALTAGLLLSVFYRHNFPACFIEGIGPTFFENVCQIFVILFFLASIFALSLKRQEFEVAALWTLIFSLSLSVLAELAFAFHTLFLRPTSVSSYVLRLIAVYLMYRVFIKTAIFAPFNTALRNLSFSEKNLFSLLEGLPAYVFVQMSDYRIQYANRVFRRLFGAPEGLTCYEILKGENVPCGNCPTREILRTGLPQHRDWGTIKGKTYAIYEYPYRGLDDSAAVLKLGIDITDRKNMETELIAARGELENRVGQRTAELTRANEILQVEIAKRQRVQESFEQSKEELRLVSLRLLHAQEMERKRIAMELHDSLGGSLSAIKFRTEYVIGQLEPSSGTKPSQLLGDIVVMLQSLLGDVRKIHSNLWPSILSDFGLIVAINWHCRKFEENFPHIQIEKSILLEEDDTPDVLKIVVYRIIQEALNNVAKHSGAYRVAIVLGKNSWGVELETRDNGKGFDVAEAHGLPEQTPESAFPE